MESQTPTTATTTEHASESCTATTAVRTPVVSSSSTSQSSAIMTNTPVSESTVVSSSVTTTPAINTTATTTPHTQIVGYFVTPMEQTVTAPSSFNSQNNTMTTTDISAPKSVVFSPLTIATLAASLTSNTASVQRAISPILQISTTSTETQTNMTVTFTPEPISPLSESILVNKGKSSTVLSTILQNNIIRDVLHKVLFNMPTKDPAGNSHASDPLTQTNGTIDILYPDSDMQSEFTAASNIVSVNDSLSKYYLQLPKHVKILSFVIIPYKNSKVLFMITEPKSIECLFCENNMNIYFYFCLHGRSFLCDHNVKQEVRPCVWDDTIRLVHYDCLKKQSNFKDGCNYLFKMQMEDVPLSEWWNNRNKLQDLIKSILRFIILSTPYGITIYEFMKYYNQTNLSKRSIYSIVTIMLSMIYLLGSKYLKKNCIRNWCKSNQKIELILWKHTKDTS